MAKSPATPRPRKKAAAPKSARSAGAMPSSADAPQPRTWEPVEAAPPPRAVAVPEVPPAQARKPIEEPVWLVRTVLLLFLIGFAAFLAREVYRFLHSF